MSAAAPRAVGARARRIEDPALLRGRGRYLDDVPVAGCLWAAFVRSPYAHARVNGVDAAPALALPGVIAVHTVDSLGTALARVQLPLQFPSDAMPKDVTPHVLARGEAAYAGEAVAMVIADSPYAAEDGANAVAVDYEPLPVAADPREAMKPGAPKVRSDAASNVLANYRLAYGAAGEAFGKAPYTVAESFFQHRGGAHPMEGRGALAAWDAATDSLTMWSSTQESHELKFLLAEMLGVDDGAIRVIAPDVGGGFGVKFVIYPEEVAVAAAARLAGRPVKWLEDRREHFIASIQERDQWWTMELAFDAEGHILGLRGQLVHDQGAYTPQGVNVAYNAASSITGPYVVPTMDLEVFVVQTNKVPVVPVRGAGYPEAAFVMERLVDRMAQALGMDPAEARARNLIPAARMPYAKPLKNRAGAQLVVDSGDYATCQARGLAAVDYAGFRARQAEARRAGRLIGIGFAHAVKPTGRGPFESARVRISPSGKVSLFTGAMAMGQGIRTSLAQVAADHLGVPFDTIEVVAGDTAFVTHGMGGFASRQAIMAGSSTHLAAGKVADKAKKVAAHMLEAAVEDLVLRNGRVEIAGTDRGIPLADIARKLKGAPGYSLPAGADDPGLEATEHFQCDAQAYSNAFHVCEAEVDPGTGGFRLTRYIAVQDSGRLINPLIAEGQVHGGVVHGIGNAMFEWMRYDDDAQPLTTTFADYLLPTSTEVPHIEVIFNETPSPINPLGVKGIGETATIPVAAAVVAAVEDAVAHLGVRLAEAPLMPVRLAELIDAAARR
jgi:carbon-monoxide dehydrogenase large subunit